MRARETFIGFKAWRMETPAVDPDPDCPPWDELPPSVPTLTLEGVTARIHWRPVGVCAWEIVEGERGECSLPVFDRADKAKQAAWAAWLTEDLDR